MKRKKVIMKQIPNTLAFSGWIPDNVSEDSIEYDLQLDKKIYGKGKTAIDFFVTEVKLKSKEFLYDLLKGENKELKDYNAKLIEAITKIHRYLEENKNDDSKINEIFKICKKLVLQNWNVYPILLNFINYIKENILRDKLGLPNRRKIYDIRVFEYIAEIIYEVSSEKTKKQLIEMVKSYYNHKFKDLISIKI